MKSGSAKIGTWIALGSMLVVGCSHVSLRSGRTHATSLPPSLAADFAYEHLPDRSCTVEVLESKSQYTVKRVLVPAVAEGSETNRWIELDYYDLAGKAKTPVIMVLPMLGGGYALERHFANYFASRGYAAVIVRRDNRAASARVEDLNG